MVERHALIPDTVTEALMHHVGAGEEGRGKHITSLTASGSSRQQGEGRMMTLEEVKAKLGQDVLLNPHDQLNRMRVDALGPDRLL